MSKDWSSYICAPSSETGKIPCVRKLDKKTGKPKGPWHLPGGKKDKTDRDEIRTAIGELKEEVGIEVREDQLLLLTKAHRRIRRKERRHNYTAYFFLANNISPEQFAERTHRTSNEEEVRDFSPRRIRAMKNFAPAHKRILRSHGLLRVADA